MSVTKYKAKNKNGNTVGLVTYELVKPVQLNAGDVIIGVNPETGDLYIEHKITFESVLDECRFRKRDSDGNSNFWISGNLTVHVRSSDCDVIIDGRSILAGYIKSPLRLKVLLDILLETHEGRVME